MNPERLDPYVCAVLGEYGWSVSRRFPLASYCARVLDACGMPCFDAAREVLRSFGGLRIRESSPSSAIWFLQKCQGDFSRLDAPYQKPLRRLHSLGLEAVPRKYTGASFDFDPLNAFFDREIVLPFDRAERITGEALFPVGSVEPDGISCVGPSGRVYTLFDDSLFLSGPSVVDYLNGRFLKELKPVPLFSLPE